MRKLIPFLFLIFISSISVNSAGINKKESAFNILNSSLKEAKETYKPVMVIFHASWCKWCRKLEHALNSPELKKIINDNFVVAYIDVLEQKDKKEELENPGGEKIMNDLGGKDAGLPFYAFLNAEGNRVADSKSMPGNQNIGYPASKEEIKIFTGLLKKSSDRLTNKQIAAVKDYLKKTSPQQ